MTEAQNLTLKYFIIITGENESSFDIVRNYYSFNFQTAIQCAISETEAVIESIDNASTIALNFGHDYHQELVNQQNIWNELKQMQ